MVSKLIMFSLEIMFQGNISMQVSLSDIRCIFRPGDKWGRGLQAEHLTPIEKEWTHPIEKKLSHSRSRWTPDVTGRQLVLGGEGGSQRSKDQQWVVLTSPVPLEQQRAVFWEKTGPVLCSSRSIVSVFSDLQWRPHTAVKIWSCAFPVYASQSAEQEALFSVSLTPWREMNNPYLLTAECLHIHLQCKKMLFC